MLGRNVPLLVTDARMFAGDVLWLVLEPPPAGGGGAAPQATA